LTIRANEAHRPILHDSSLYERVCIHFRPEAVDTFDPERRLLIPFDERPLGQNNLYAPHVTRESGLTDCFDTLAKSDEDKYDNGIRVHTQFCRILCILSDLYKEKTATSADVNPLVMAIVDYINRNLVQSLSLERLCNEFYLSKSHLQRLFRDATGSTVWDYILLKRLTLAQKLLRSGCSAVAASMQSGFSEYSTFFRAYKKRFGYPPSEHI
jgi:AraC-like DNA-binding protein